MKLLQYLRAQFALGFHEGWNMYWSPFTGMAREVKKLWATHIHRRPNLHA